MILDLDIFRSANLLVKQHGKDAPPSATRGGKIGDEGWC